MCGRFSLAAEPGELQAAFPGFFFPEKMAPRYNIAPSQPVLALPNNVNKTADLFIWGLIPSWSKDPSFGARLINARAEGVSEKPSFRGSYKYKRCILPATGFYEWKKANNGKTKTPYNIGLLQGGIFGFAGLWDEWLSPDGSVVKTCTIITTSPNPMMSEIHDRMPVILEPESYAEWLNPAPVKPGELDHLLVPFNEAKMTAYPVSTLVNSPANESPLCIQGIA